MTAPVEFDTEHHYTPASLIFTIVIFFVVMTGSCGACVYNMVSPAPIRNCRPT